MNGFNAHQSVTLIVPGLRVSICVVHETGFRRAVADRVILMAAGQFVEDGIPERIFTNPQYQVTRDFKSAFSA